MTPPRHTEESPTVAVEPAPTEPHSEAGFPDDPAAPVYPEWRHVEVSVSEAIHGPAIQSDQQHIPPATEPPPLVTDWSDADIGQYSDVLALFRRIEFALQTGDVASIGRDVDRYYAWILAEGVRAPAWLRQAALSISQVAQDQLNKVPASEPLPLPKDGKGNPFLLFFLAQRRYEWAISTRQPDLIRAEMEAIIEWLGRVQDTCVGFERDKVQQLIADMRAELEPSDSTQHQERIAARSDAADSTKESPEAFDPEDDEGEGGAVPQEHPLFVACQRTYAWEPDAPLMTFSSIGSWTMQDSYEGTLILGSVGSGKTSGSGAAPHRRRIQKRCKIRCSKGRNWVA